MSHSTTNSPPTTPDSRSTQWFVREVHPHDGQLKAYLRGRFPAVRDVDDVVQESYLRIWRVQAAQPINSAKAFLFRVARNIALDWLRREQVAPLERSADLAGLEVADQTPDSGQVMITRELLDLLAEVIGQLPDRCRAVVILHKLRGMPQKDVAAQLGLSVRTVEKHCLRGLNQCERRLREHGIAGFFG
ncbi:RNA polymerase sigma factor [Actomonas aquatica]|uniref:RNA polymerase sigma factor n=1 Tax=Actomonas aquatica TaxID=2866162 RepID=A0ABZ1C3D0_9BACT|nr:RNA polymerase sigma factor [Opitutus sp. WL0086]WRQ85773.1 RNA polymerase sigma factor [Opitutus sp. WL0086]